MLEVLISHFIDALTEEKTKVPRRGLYVKLQKTWPSAKKETNKLEDLIRFDLSKVQVGSPLYDIAREATEEIREAL